MGSLSWLPENHDLHSSRHWGIIECIRIHGGNCATWVFWIGQLERLKEVAWDCVPKTGITHGDTVVGTSLGGMVACEIAKCCQYSSFVLLSSATHPDEVSALLRLLHPLIQCTPLKFLQECSSKMPWELCRMFSEVDPVFLRNMGGAFFRWDGLQETGPVPFRIHGMLDGVIPPPENTKVLIPRGHLVATTHAEECVKALQSFLQIGESESAWPSPLASL